MFKTSYPILYYNSHKSWTIVLTQHCQAFVQGTNVQPCGALEKSKFWKQITLVKILLPLGIYCNLGNSLNPWLPFLLLVKGKKIYVKRLCEEYRCQGKVKVLLASQLLSVAFLRQHFSVIIDILCRRGLVWLQLREMILSEYPPHSAAQIGYSIHSIVPDTSWLIKV